MAKTVRRLLDEADVVTTWNGVSFDEPYLRSLLFTADLHRPSPWQSLDLFRFVKKEFRAPSNKLDYWANHLGVGSKIKHEGFRLWLGCMNGDEKAWARMARYCRQDVNLTEQLLDRFDSKGWLPPTVHAGLFGGDENGCPNCGSGRRQRRGVYRTKLSTYPRFYCTDCGTWYRGMGLADARPKTRAVK